MTLEVVFLLFTSSGLGNRFVKCLNTNVVCLKTNTYLPSVLDVDAFERLLGPCVDIMSRNVANYEAQLAELFGEVSIDDLRR